MKILITGAAGLVGSALADAYGSDAIPLRHRDLDITDADAVARVVREHRPDVIFNCAVIGVDDCEADPARAEAINVTGPVNLARHVRTIVHFSSNYVFDGDRDDVAYSIEDEAKPINAYGATKLQGELAVAAAAERAFIVRTSWVFGPGKESFLSTVAAKLARGERVRAIADTFASTTYVADLVERLMDVVAHGEPGTYQLVNDGVCSYETFAREAARIVGIENPAIDIINESRPAPRPRWTPMECVPPMRPWQEALAAYLRR